MSEKKINLEEILNNQIDKDFNFRLFYGEATTNRILSAMKEACKQVLELAAENADTKEFFDHYNQWIGDFVDKDSILNTINQVE